MSDSLPCHTVRAPRHARGRLAHIACVAARARKWLDVYNSRPAHRPRALSCPPPRSRDTFASVAADGVALSVCEPIDHQLTAQLVNHFVSNTTAFLNSFCATTNKSLNDIAVRISTLQVTLAILEAKLASVPELDEITVKKEESKAAVEPKADGEPAADAPVAAAPKVMTVREDPAFKTYFNMVRRDTCICARGLTM